MKLKAVAKEARFEKDFHGAARPELVVTFVENAAGDARVNLTPQEYEAFKARLREEGPFVLEVEVVLGTFDKPQPT